MKFIGVLSILLSISMISSLPCLKASAKDCKKKCGDKGYLYCTSTLFLFKVSCHCKNGEVLSL